MIPLFSGSYRDVEFQLQQDLNLLQVVDGSWTRSVSLRRLGEGFFEIE